MKLKDELNKLRQEKIYTVTVNGTKYGVTLYADTEVGGYFAQCRELSVTSYGGSVRESLNMIKNDIELHLEEIESNG